MNVMRMWSICDRCGFKLRRNKLRAESTGFVVCAACHDGAYDIKNHPQNTSARPRREPTIVPDGRLDVVFPPVVYLTTEDGRFILTENGKRILISGRVWDPRDSVYF